MEDELRCCMFENLDLDSASQRQSLVSLIEINFLCNIFEGLSINNDVHDCV